MSPHRRRRINREGLELIKRFEGVRLRAYLCPAGVWTIGYGHTAGVTQGMRCSQEEADAMLAADLERFERGVSSLLTRSVRDNEFAALVSFAFNVGLANLARSRLLKRVNAHDPRASDEFMKWTHARGKRLPGLVRRRAAEAALFEMRDHEKEASHV